ncbi:NANOS1 (predicted) [Pycnogonum litorale]
MEFYFSKFFPLNPSLAAELERLSGQSSRTRDWCDNKSPLKLDECSDGTHLALDSVLEEFRNNGVESEYSPEPFNWPPRRLTASKNLRKALPRECVFCKNNGEQPFFYLSHVLKDKEGKVRCPILRDYTCPICGVNGDSAHTLKYCPKNKN